MMTIGEGDINEDDKNLSIVWHKNIINILDPWLWSRTVMEGRVYYDGNQKLENQKLIIDFHQYSFTE